MASYLTTTKNKGGTGREKIMLNFEIALFIFTIVSAFIGSKFFRCQFCAMFVLVLVVSIVVGLALDYNTDSIIITGLYSGFFALVWTIDTKLIITDKRYRNISE